MRICRFNGNRLGLVQGDEILDVTKALEILPSSSYPFPGHDVMIENLGELQIAIEECSGSSKRLELSNIVLESPVANPSKLIGAPVNYTKHLEEVRDDEALNHANQAHMRQIQEIGLFLKATSSLIGAGSAVQLRMPDRRSDYEIELAVIIGKDANNVKAEDALDFVAGYSICFDMTIRGPEERSLRKSLDTYSVLGPWLVTSDEIPDPSNLDFELKVNGKTCQKANTSDLVLSVPELIEFASKFYTLRPGDIIFTGTPEGVGPVVPGDIMHARVEGIGEMSVSVTSAS